uniref:Uncharacterized protein n=1 Tax=Candidatus Kentrum sp. DK TaxID=2126562 RepID=A0A450T5E8_9GAMM|nr:MAG: hypothetical protein BECKDK2373B_GA0170837_110512 [Candidatus Kentron sp. DK]VFJ70411.1 MAG: hypothetical protein BECKDK2373C_GA0170839_12612 [Candidatus Kentron sp. DK]
MQKSSIPASRDKSTSNDPNPEFGLWRGTRAAVLFLVFSVVAAFSLTLSASILLDQAKTRFAQQEERFRETKTGYQRLDREMATTRAYLPRFRALVNSAGFIGEEQRLTWLEALRNAAWRIGLPALDYTISSRTPYRAPGFPLDTAPYQLHASEMQLTMGLLHEGDLFSLLAELDRHAVGLHDVAYCHLRRVGGEPARDPGRANIGCECVLRWYTLERQE